MNRIKPVGLLVAALFAGSVVYVASATDFTGLPQEGWDAQQQTSECSDPNPVHIATINQDSEQVGYAFAVPDGPTFYAGHESWFLNFDNHASVEQLFPLAESLDAGFYVVRAEWVKPTPLGQLVLFLTNSTSNYQGQIHNGLADYFGNRVLVWEAFQIRDFQLGVVGVWNGEAQTWNVNLWKVECLPWGLSNQYVW